MGDWRAPPEQRTRRRAGGDRGGDREVPSGPSDGSTPLAEALARAPARYQRLLDFVEWKLIEMPLRRLQIIGDESVTFPYAINWTQSVRPPDATSVARAAPSTTASSSARAWGRRSSG